jgi:hypothetical protein
MKKVRFVLSALAFVFAIGGAVASQALFVAEDGYEFIDNNDPFPDQCVFRDDICDGGTHDCKLTSSSPTLRRWIGSETACGVELKRSTAP